MEPTTKLPPRDKTISLPYATWKQLKLLAIEQHLTMHALVQRLLDTQTQEPTQEPGA